MKGESDLWGWEIVSDAFGYEDNCKEERYTVDKKTEKVLDSILSVLIAIVGEILTNRNKEENKKDSE